MLGTLVHKFQTIGGSIGSPLGSPIVSPLSSPKDTRKGYGGSIGAKHLTHRRTAMKQEFREVQSDPEDTIIIGNSTRTAVAVKKYKMKRKMDKRKQNNNNKSSVEIEMISSPIPLLRTSKSMGRLDGLKQVQRLSEYEQYLENLLNETRLENEREAEEINRIKGRCKQTLKRGQCESDLERIQDLFPNDCLRLYDTDALTMKVKGLMRKRSGPAARLHRALSTKSLRSESPPSSRTSSTTDGIEQRQFVMEAPVHFTAGVQSQDRHLFLFNDLLLIAKARSGGNFKLKEKVRISEIWLTKCCMDEVSELNKSEATSFVLGWPTTNVVVTFTTQAARDLWWNKLHDLYRTENEKEPCSTNVQVVYYDIATNIEYCKTFSVGPEETAKDCIRLALEHLEMRHLDPDHFQLWAKTAREESPYPLIGHERPFSIKLSCLRDSLSSEEGFDLDHCNNVHDPVARCHFILRNAVKVVVNENKKSFKKLSTRGMKIGHVFRKSVNNNNNVKEQSAAVTAAGCLFGLPLTKLSDGENLPKPVMGMLYQVFAKGPFMQGIFRKSANARLVRELREKLDSGEDVSWEHVPVLVTAALLKDFLRSLPDPLLTTHLYPQWRAAIETPSINTKLFRMKGVIAQLPKANHLLLTHFLCVLYHIARRSCHTLMSAANLGVCVGPSLLWSNCPNVCDDLRVVPAIVECLISHCEFLCGSHIPSLLGDLRDSGTEESDSMKRDDSSIDSLECSPPPRKDKMSLSRDSGLTMSDSQLYTPDEEESGSTSSSGYDPAFESHSKISPSISVPGNYVRVYGGWEERLNPNFQRQAWFRQRSRRSSSSTVANHHHNNNNSNNNNNMNNKTTRVIRRSASEESLLDSKPLPPTPPRRNNKLPTSNVSLSATQEYYRDTNNYPSAVYKKTANHNNSNSYRVSTLEHASIPCSSSSSTSSFKDANGTQKDYSQKKNKSAFNSENNDTINDATLVRKVTNADGNHYANVRLLSSTISSSSSSTSSARIIADDKKSSTVIGFGAGDFYYTPKNLNSMEPRSSEIKNSECEDSSTLSDDDCTPHVSRSNSRGNEVSTLIRQMPTVATSSGLSMTNNNNNNNNNNSCVVRPAGRLKHRKEERAAYRSRSVPPPPPYRPPPPATSRRAPITSYCVGQQSSSSAQKCVITRTFMDEESYV